MRTEAGKPRVARGIRLAFGNQPGNGELRALRVLKRDDQEMRRRDAVEDETLDAFGVTACVDHVESRAVRTADEHEPAISQRRAKLVQVVGGDRSRVKAQIGGAGQTRAAT